MTLTNGGLTVTPTKLGNQSIRGTIGKSTGKLYVEIMASTLPNGASQYGPGLADAAFGVGTYLGAANYSLGAFANPGTFIASAGFVFNVASPTHTASANDVYQIAVDLSAGNVWLGYNNTWASGNPSTGAAPTASIVSPALGLLLFPAWSATSAADVAGSWTLQATAASQKYAPPAGFSAWDAAAAPSAGLGTTFALGVSPIG
jgi:hypothetical protein